MTNQSPSQAKIEARQRAALYTEIEAAGLLDADKAENKAYFAQYGEARREAFVNYLGNRYLIKFASKQAFYHSTVAEWEASQ